ncbi:MAG: hypothetical protein WC091_03675 [Sulfuricellaceae bacterium]
MVALNNFIIYFAFTRLVRTAAGWIARFSGRMAALQLQEKAMERPLRVVAPLVPRPQAVGYALHPENRTLQPVQRRFLG